MFVFLDLSSYNNVYQTNYNMLNASMVINLHVIQIFSLHNKTFNNVNKMQLPKDFLVFIHNLTEFVNIEMEFSLNGNGK